MVNLITNAIKYSPAGGDVLIYTEDAKGKVKIYVRDMVVGIPEDI